jgi:tetratricopeptide (TPR) repeat protein
MKLSDHHSARWLLLFTLSASLILFFGVNQFAQTKSQLPRPTGRVNDFAGVVDEKTRVRLENVLENVKQKTGIEFDIATVSSTGGQDIFDYSQQLALDWGVGARGTRRKSLLLVLSVNEKTSFTQFSKSVQNELPEGVLGEMGQRMRSLVNAGQFSEGLNAGVQHFLSSMAQKLGITAEDFDEAAPVVSATNASATDKSANAATDKSTPRPVDDSLTPGSSPGGARRATSESVRAAVKTSPPRDGNTPSKNKVADTSADDEADSEEVELTLTLPLAERVLELKAFLEEKPESKSRDRATELLISARAALGDERLKKGDKAGGIEQLMLAISEAPINASEKLFSGVISQIPLNLYLRGETAAATRAAQSLEAKFGSDPRRLLAISGFYVATEQGSEALRVATQAVSLAPDMAEAHQVLARALHISLRLEEAAAEYKRALELDPNSKTARRGLADLNRAFGKNEEAVALYRQQLAAEPADKAARAGLILSLLDLNRTEEAKTELEKTLQEDPRNLMLLSGVAYWFAAHNDSELAMALASKAVEIEPRYTWSQVALARALVAQNKPLEAERAIRFARLYGKFPTLDYELANALAAAGLYDEAAEILTQSFSVKDNQIETRLAGHVPARGVNFIELLAPERRASIFQSAAADTENNARILKALLTFATFIKQENDGAINEAGGIAAAKEFAAGEDAARVHRQLYAASRLLQKGIGFQTVYELAEAARSSADVGMSVPALTVAIQADEFREIRARAISSGGTPDIPDAPRNVLSNLLRGRIEELSGWALFNQDKLDEAVEHLKRATNILPEGTPALRTSLWHLGAALERQDKKEEALTYYIKSYNAGEPDAVRRSLIEQLYRKINGSVAGLDERIGAASAPAVDVQTPARDTTSSPAQPASSPETTPSTTTPVPPSVEAATRSLTTSAETAATTVAQPTTSPSPERPSSNAPLPTSPSPPPSTVPSPPTSTETSSQPVGTPASETPPAPSAENTLAENTYKAPAIVKITGRVRDSSNNPLANVVVVLISPQGTVLASTTDDQGNYSFNVAPSTSTHSYRIIPSRDGFTFEPVDRVLPVVGEDQKELDFVGRHL